MSSANQINRLTSAKTALKASIQGKGVAVPGDAKINQYAALIDQIPQGVNGGESYKLIFNGSKDLDGSFPSIKVPTMSIAPLLIKGYAVDFSVNPYRFYHFSVLTAYYTDGIDSELIALPPLSEPYGFASSLQISVNYLDDGGFDTIYFSLDAGNNGNGFNLGVSVVITHIYVAPDVYIGTHWSNKI